MTTTLSTGAAWQFLSTHGMRIGRGDVEILEFAPEGPLQCVRPYCNNEHHGQIYIDTHKAVSKAFGDAAPESPVAPRNR